MGSARRRWAAVRVVARSQGFDLLAVTEGAPFAIEARRAAVSTSPLALDFAGDTGTLISDMLDSFEADASGELLTLCHNHADGDPILFSSFTGAYTPASSATLYGDGALCDGIAWNGSTGVVVVNKRLPSGQCCSRPVAAPISTAGQVMGPETPVLPDEEFNDARLARYGGGYVTAAYVKAPAVYMRFALDGGAVSTATIPISMQEDLGTRPRLAAWPFDATRAAVAFMDGPATAHIAVVDEAGTTHHTTTITAAAPVSISTPAPVALTDGLLYAVATCPPDPGQGSVTIALLGADGAPIAAPASVATDCPLRPTGGAASDDTALFVWGSRGALVQVTR